MKTVVYLVHGTWPEGPPFAKASASVLRPVVHAARVLCRQPKGKELDPLWFNEGSSFRVGLSKALGVEHRYVEVKWSGKNRLSARVEGADRLRAALLEGFARDPRDRHIVIAHSHGGNAAIHGIDGLNPAFLPHGLATLATPFLEIQRRKTTKVDTFLNMLLAGLGLILHVMVTGLLMSLNGFVGFMWFISVLLYLYVYKLHRPRVKSGRNSIYKSLIFRRRRMFQRGRTSLLVIRGNNDEATLSLTLANLAARFNDSALSLATLFLNCYLLIARVAAFIFLEAIHLWLAVALVVGTVYGGISLFYEEGQITTWLSRLRLPDALERFGESCRLAGVAIGRSRLDVTATLVAFIVFLAPILFVFLALKFLARVLLTPFGVELFFVADTVVSRVSISPMGVVPHFYLVPDLDLAGGLRHAVYKSRSAQAELARWIRSLDVIDPCGPSGNTRTPECDACASVDPPTAMGIEADLATRSTDQVGPEACGGASGVPSAPG